LIVRTDTTGKPVAWLENTSPVGTLKPFKPFKTMGGWSNLTFTQWLAQ